MFSHTSVFGKHLQCERNSTSYLYDRWHIKAIISPYRVGAPSKHAQNEGENTSTATTQHQTQHINEQIRSICIQDSGPRGYKHNPKQKKWGVQSKTTQLIEPTLAQHEHNNCGKKPEMRPKQCVFDPRNNGRIVMEYYNHLFVAYATLKCTYPRC